MKRFVVALVVLAVSCVVAPRVDAAGPSLLDGRPLCGTATPPPGPTPIADDGVLKVATFNLLHSDLDEADRSLGDRLPLAADALVASGADIIGAQEVARNSEFVPGDEYPQRHGLVAERLAALIAARTGQPWHWCWSRSNPHIPLTPDITVGGGNILDDLAAMFGNLPDTGTFSEGLAVFTRFPIERSRFHRMLPRSYEALACLNTDPFCALDAIFDARQVLWARVATPAGKVDMFTTHLAHHIGALSTLTKTLQARQALIVAQKWAADDAVPDFLVGDFNSTPSSVAYGVIRGGGFVDTYSAAGGVECTAPGSSGCSGGPIAGEETYTTANVRPMEERIDYVWARSSSSCAVDVPTSYRIGDTATQLPDGRYIWPSDHYGFVSTVNCD